MAIDGGTEMEDLMHHLPVVGAATRRVALARYDLAPYAEEGRRERHSQSSNTSSTSTSSPYHLRHTLLTVRTSFSSPKTKDLRIHRRLA